ncbi:hypothetical protein CBLAS_1193 [Campylobacter blaseri]|uniref:AsmA family protein n=1 Tax=Campylobacter blaseri TaxID=2042961 RepID=A0A2P8QZU0_9BACT|nr:hypothetical protein [Campylobacter blaseri]PSM51766.1 hypothetical protein CQ405_06455 [Campylobacter blaseri]PSM53557.1 hypothetical protein CRN67_06460 [Campylobacter blaseri]QKF86365.1 hypothetical protein CBLAS_1193 [Campylobacter blaseri]
MKFIKGLVVLLLLMLVAVYVVAFTSFGNNLVKPYIEKTIKEKSGYDVKLSKFELKFGSLDVDAVVNDEIMANVNGKYSLFAQSFDLNYKVDVNNLKSFGLNLDEKMDLSGKAKGKAKDFSVNGSGKMLDSNVRFLANLKDFKPFNVDLDAKGLNVKKALALANQPLYLDGLINAVANVKEGTGTATITSSNLIVQKDGLKDQNISIPENIPLDLKSDIALENNIVIADTNVKSKLANISVSNTTYNLNANSLTSDFLVDIDKLANLEPFVGQKLNGSLQANGNVEVEKNALKSLNLDAKTLGGSLKATTDGKKLNANIDNFSLGSIFVLTGQKILADGKLNGNIILDSLDIKNLNGKIDLNIQDGILNEKELKNLTQFDFPKNIKFSEKSDITIKSSVIDFKNILNSDLLNVSKFDGSYDLNKATLSAVYKASIDNLSKFAFLTGQKIDEKLDVDGDVKLVNNALSSLNLNATTLGGSLKAVTNGKSLTANLNNFNLGSIFMLAGQKVLANGKINGSIDLDSFDVKNLNGKANLNIIDGVLNHIELSKLMEKDFPKNIKFNQKADVNIVKSVANFKALINSDLANLSKFDGSFDINKALFNANYEALIKDLSKLQFATGMKMNGEVLANGNIKKSGENFSADLNSNLIGGKLNASIKNEIIRATFDKFQITELLYLLDFNKFYKGIGDLVFNYNTKSQKGDFNVDIHEGQLTQGKLTSAVSLATGRDITKEVFNNSYIRGTINKNMIYFDSNMKAPTMELNVTKGTLDTITSQINIPVDIQVQKTDISAMVTGTTQDPKVKVSSKYLEKKLEKQIDKGLDKLFGGSKKDGATENATDDGKKSEKDIVKGLIKGLF